MPATRCLRIQEHERHASKPMGHDYNGMGVVGEAASEEEQRLGVEMVVGGKARTDPGFLRRNQAVTSRGSGGLSTNLRIIINNKIIHGCRRDVRKFT